MASRHMLQSTCDSCHAQAEMPFEKQPRNRRDLYILPDGWIHVQGNSRRSLVFEMDLCDRCAKTVREMAGRADLAKV